jgi:hypothetical protein
MTCPRRVTSKDVGKLVRMGRAADPTYNVVVGVSSVNDRHFISRAGNWWSHGGFVAVSESFHVDPTQPAGGQATPDLESPV